jgi:hypothetical protein
VRLLGRLSFEPSYSFILSKQRLDYDYDSAGALAGVTPQQAGSRFEELRTEDHVVQASLRLQVREGVALRVLYLFQREKIDDFQQDGLRGGLVASSLFLGHEDEDYDAHVIGATLQLRF